MELNVWFVLGYIMISFILHLATIFLMVKMGEKVEIASNTTYALEVFSEKAEEILESIVRCLEKYSELFNVSQNKQLRYYTEGSDLYKAHVTDAGMDISSNEDLILKPNEYYMFKTGIYGILPTGTVINVKPRSGLACKHGIDTLAGVVDEDYTGEIRILLLNNGNKDFEVKRGDRIAQLVMSDVHQSMPIKINKNEFDRLKLVKERGTKGFGSSGIKQEN